MSYHVYLAGPITGCTYEECVAWREDFIRSVPYSIKCLSPMRGKTRRGSTCREEATGSAEISKSDNILRQASSIMARDYFDCMRADVIVFNMLGTTRVSIGTCMEMAWGYANQTPMIFIMEKEGNLHDHAMVRACGGFWCETIDEAKQTLLAILDVDHVGHDLEEMAKRINRTLDPRAGDPL